MDPTANVTMQNLESRQPGVLATAVADRVAKEAKYYEMQNARPDAIADTLSNGLVATLRGVQAKLERDYAEKLNLYKPEWPAMQQLKAQIDKGRQQSGRRHQRDGSESARERAERIPDRAPPRGEPRGRPQRAEERRHGAQNSNAVEYNNLKVEIDTKTTLLDNL